MNNPHSDRSELVILLEDHQILLEAQATAWRLLRSLMGHVDQSTIDFLYSAANLVDAEVAASEERLDICRLGIDDRGW